MIDLRLGNWREALADVGEVDAIITDPPYSQRTHEGHDRVENPRDGRERRVISYSHFTPEDVHAFVAAWAPRCRGWFVCLSDLALAEPYRLAYEAAGLTAFSPVGILIPGMTVRLCGDGPSAWFIAANVARTKRLAKWGTLPGGYQGPPGERVHIGGKPLWLMRALVRDYSRPGDLVVDPFAGAATTLIAAATENRRAIGSEVDAATYEVARERCAKGYTPSLISDEPTTIKLATGELFK